MRFFEKVYEVVELIPFGKVTTYGAIADYLAEGSARSVGWALNQSHKMGLEIPAHRVVNRKGELSGRNHFEGEGLMAALLMKEGIRVNNSKIINFKKHLWIPTEQLL